MMNFVQREKIKSIAFVGGTITDAVHVERGDFMCTEILDITDIPIPLEIEEKLIFDPRKFRASLRSERVEREKDEYKERVLAVRKINSYPFLQMKKRIETEIEEIETRTRTETRTEGENNETE